MNHLVVYAHPNINSFTNAISVAVKNFSIQQEYKTEVRDLYSIGFNPVLSASDLSGISSDKVPEDIRREQSYIEWAEIITFIYPVWWTGMPAILKGYIDRVFSYGMAYKQGSNGSEGVLKDKRVFIFNPMGTSNETYNKNGMIDAMKQVNDIGIFSFCGMKVEQHAFFGGVSNGEEEIRKKYLQAVSEIYSRSLKSEKNNSKCSENKDSESDSQDKDKSKNSNNGNSSNDKNNDGDRKNKDGQSGNEQKNNEESGSNNNNKDMGIKSKENNNEKNTNNKEEKNNKAGNTYS